MPTRIILYASARSNGNTAVIAQYLAKVLDAPSIDLSARAMAPFSYENDYPNGDAYLETLQEILPFDEWIFLTPVYWYTMSAQMKIFIDRFSDVLRYHPQFRPAIVGKGMWAMCCSSTAEHKGELHTWGGRVQELKPAVKDLIDGFIAEHQFYK